jgi:hypothetical protein
MYPLRRLLVTQMPAFKQFRAHHVLYNPLVLKMFLLVSYDFQSKHRLCPLTALTSLPLQRSYVVLFLAEKEMNILTC